jgi:ribonuclease P protein component
MLARTGRFRRLDRILRSREFSHVLGHGERRRSRDFVVIAHKDEQAQNAETARARRLGITVSRRVGNSVVRNRVKRGIREWFRQSRCGLPEGFEIVVIARPPARDLTTRQVGDALSTLVGDWMSEEFKSQMVELEPRVW